MALQSSQPKTQSQLSEEFMSHFNKCKENLTERITLLLAIEGQPPNEQLTELSTEIQKLNKSLHDAVIFLPSYSVKIRQDEIRDLEKKLKEKEDTLIPRKKFGFKPKAKVLPSLNSPIDFQAKDNFDVKVSREITTCKDNYLTIENISKTTVLYQDDQLNGNDVLIKDCEDAILILEGGPSTLRLVNLKNCKLLCGPVRTSVFVDSVQESVLFLCCQQLRTHSSTKVDVYLRVRSRAIIEDCQQIRFGPYDWNHAKSEELHVTAEINVNLERYDAVDDFNWLSAEPSPNWSLIPSEERITFQFS